MKARVCSPSVSAGLKQNTASPLKFVVALKKSMQTHLVSEVTGKDLDQCFPAKTAKKGIECMFQSKKQSRKGSAGEHNSKHGMCRGPWE